MSWLGTWDAIVQAALTLAIGLIVWLMCRLLISAVVRRVSNGELPFRRKGLRWAAPVLAPLDSERRTQRARTIGSLLKPLCNVTIGVIVLIYVLLSFGIEVGPLVASLGIVGVAVGFGCQQLVRDFLAGVFLAIEDQYGIGDVVEIADVVGTVESVGLRVTRLRGEDGATWYMRNGEIVRVGNRTQGEHSNEDEGRTKETGKLSSDETQGPSA